MRRHEALLLLAAAGVFTVLSAVPAPLVSDPAGGGPRYFFLPFIAFGWLLLALWRDSRCRQAPGRQSACCSSVSARARNDILEVAGRNEGRLVGRRGP